MDNTPKPKIAFIDDEQRILRSLKMHFRPTHDVFTTTDPQALFDYVATNQVHVVVSDQRMPDIQGTEVLQKIKTISPHTIRILLTGYADLNAVVDSINEGEIYRYITKPWQNDELKLIINKATNIALQTQDIELNPADSMSNFSERHLLILDDDKATYEQMKAKFEPAYRVSWADTLDKAAELLHKKKFGVAISDVTLNGENIAPVIYSLKNLQPDLMMLMLTEYKDAHSIIDLINKGQIYRCLPRPTNLAMMEISLQRAYQHHEQLLQQPILASRHHVEAVVEDEQFNFSQRIKGFLSKLKIW